MLTRTKESWWPIHSGRSSQMETRSCSSIYRLCPPIYCPRRPTHRHCPQTQREMCHLYGEFRRTRCREGRMRTFTLVLPRLHEAAIRGCMSRRGAVSAALLQAGNTCRPCLRTPYTEGDRGVSRQNRRIHLHRPHVLFPAILLQVHPEGPRLPQCRLMSGLLFRDVHVVQEGAPYWGLPGRSEHEAHSADRCCERVAEMSKVPRYRRARPRLPAHDMQVGFGLKDLMPSLLTMFDRCKAEWCYRCGDVWKTCLCNDWDEGHLHRRAEDLAIREVGANANPLVLADLALQIRGDLQQHHECEHMGGWEYSRGTAQCEMCSFLLPQYIFVCSGCRLRACNRCRRNRI